MPSSVSDMLTQRANVYARVQSWDADGAEVFGDETLLYSREPCLVIPMTPERSALAGLNFGQRGYLAMFQAGRYITRSKAGQAYQEVRLEIVASDRQTVSYMVMGPQELFGENFDIPDLEHVEVPVTRRDSA